MTESCGTWRCHHILLSLRSEQRVHSRSLHARQSSMLSKGHRGFHFCCYCKWNLQAYMKSPLKNSSPIIFFLLHHFDNELRSHFLMELVSVPKLLKLRFLFCFTMSGILEFSSTPPLLIQLVCFFGCVLIMLLRLITWFYSVVYIKMMFSTWLLQISRVC